MCRTEVPGQEGKGVADGKFPGQWSQSVVLPIVNLGTLNAKPVLGAKESSGMICLLESEMRWVNQLPKDKPIQKAKNEGMEKSLRIRIGAASHVPPMAVPALHTGGCGTLGRRTWEHV